MAKEPATTKFTDQLEQLALLVSTTEGGVLAFALYSLVEGREEAVWALKEELSLPVEEIGLSRQRKNPIDMLRAISSAERCCVFFFNAEQGLPDLAGYVNLQREALNEMPHAVIFWTTEEVLREIATRAPDFWAWRSGVFDFRAIGEEARRQSRRANPVLYLSSTIQDLVPYRETVRDAALAAGFRPVLADELPPADMLARVDDADMVAVILAHRYGYVVPGLEVSIAELECHHAASRGKPLFVFLVDEDYPWPPKFIDRDANYQRLRNFKQWLTDRSRPALFTTPESLKRGLMEALVAWTERHANGGVATAAYPSLYLEALRWKTLPVAMEGTANHDGQVRRNDLYIALKGISSATSRSFPLERALDHRCVLIVGKPGSGKTTFLRRVANDLATNWLEKRTLPILIRLGEIRSGEVKASGDWLITYLADRHRAENADAPFFRKRLEKGPCLVLLDGLDEAVSDHDQSVLGQMIEDACRRYPRSRFVATSRPNDVTDGPSLDSFVRVDIVPLDDEEIVSYLTSITVLSSDRLKSGPAAIAVAVPPHQPGLDRSQDLLPGHTRSFFWSEGTERE